MRELHSVASVGEQYFVELVATALGGYVAEFVRVCLSRLCGFAVYLEAEFDGEPNHSEDSQSVRRERALWIVAADNLLFDVGDAAQRVDDFVVGHVVVDAVARKIAAHRVLTNVRGKAYFYRRVRSAVGVTLDSERRVFKLVVAVANNRGAELVVDYFGLVSAADSQRFGRGGTGNIDVGIAKSGDFIAHKTTDRVNRARGHTV